MRLTMRCGPAITSTTAATRSFSMRVTIPGKRFLADPVTADRSTDCAEMFRRSFKNRKLHPVKTRPPDACEQGKVLLGDMRRPQEHVET